MREAALHYYKNNIANMMDLLHTISQIPGESTTKHSDLTRSYKDITKFMEEKALTDAKLLKLKAEFCEQINAVGDWKNKYSAIKKFEKKKLNKKDEY